MMKNKKFIIPYSHPSSLIPHPCERGFTLVEMAIILVVIGILVGLGSGIVGMLSRNIKYTESREIVDADVESVISYAAGNDYLPTSGTWPTVVRNPNDAFLQSLVYVSDSALTGSGTICGKKTTYITLHICTDVAPACTTYTTVSNVAFIVLSNGDDYTTETTPVSSPVSTATTINVFNSDIVKYVTLFELKAKIKCD